MRIVMPLVKPALATLAIFNFIGNWNAFLWPSLLHRHRRCTLFRSVCLTSPAKPHQMGAHNDRAAVSTIPLIIFFIIFQKQIVKDRHVGIEGIKAMRIIDFTSIFHTGFLWKIRRQRSSMVGPGKSALEKGLAVRRSRSLAFSR